MSNTPIKKLLIGLIFLLLICLSMPLGAAACEIVTVEAPGQSKYTTPIIHSDYSFTPGASIEVVTCSLSPNDGSATLSCSSIASSRGQAWIALRFHENACGTYTATVQYAGKPCLKYKIKHKRSCPTAPSSGTTSSSGATEPRKLFIVSGDNQTGLIGEPLADPFVVRVRDREQDNKPLEGVKVTFTVLTGGGSLSTTTAITDISGFGKKYTHPRR